MELGPGGEANGTVSLVGTLVSNITGLSLGSEIGSSVGRLVGDPLGPVGSLVTVGAGLNVALLGSEVAIVGNIEGDTAGEEVGAQISGISRQIVGLKLGPGGETDGALSPVGTLVSNIGGLVSRVGLVDTS